MTCNTILLEVWKQYPFYEGQISLNTGSGFLHGVFVHVFDYFIFFCWLDPNMSCNWYFGNFEFTMIIVSQVGALQDVRSELTKLRGVLFYKVLEDLHAHLYNKGEHG